MKSENFSWKCFKNIKGKDDYSVSYDLNVYDKSKYTNNRCVEIISHYNYSGGNSEPRSFKMYLDDEAIDKLRNILNGVV